MNKINKIVESVLLLAVGKKRAKRYPVFVPGIEPGTFSVLD